MKKVIERIVKSPGSPNTNDMWLDDNLSLKVYDNEEWKSIAGGSGSGSGSGSVEGEGSDLQIVELTYDHIPATGTLSASDLAKLDSDNCLLIMKGKYFRKTYGSDGGIDYKEISLSTVLGGVRSIYFTASKPDGEYTIAYTYPVEANTQTQATTALENIKVGNTTYRVPLSPMIVRGTTEFGNNTFIPSEDSPTFAEALAHMLDGGLVYMVLLVDGEPIVVILANLGRLDLIAAYASDGLELLWHNPEQSSDPTVS